MPCFISHVWEGESPPRALHFTESSVVQFLFFSVFIVVQTSAIQRTVKLLLRSSGGGGAGGGTDSSLALVVT